MNKVWNSRWTRGHSSYFTYWIAIWIRKKCEKNTFFHQKKEEKKSILCEPNEHSWKRKRCLVDRELSKSIKQKYQKKKDKQMKKKTSICPIYPFTWNWINCIDWFTCIQLYDIDHYLSLEYVNKFSIQSKQRCIQATVTMSLAFTWMHKDKELRPYSSLPRYLNRIGFSQRIESRSAIIQ